MDPASPTNPQVPPSIQNPVVDSPELGKTARIKRFFFQTLIGCLVGAAGIAVIAVLLGSFNDTLSRALATIAAVAIHAVLSFGYISETEKRDKQDGGRSIELFSNAVFTLVVVSFITSLFAVWQLLDGGLTFKLYSFYGVLLFAILHADILYRIRRLEKRIDNVVNANYAVMAVVVLMLSALIFSNNREGLGEFFYRLLAANGIVDATLTITAIIIHKMYLQKHPEAVIPDAVGSATKPRSILRNPLVVILLILLAFQLIGSLLGLIFRGFS